MFVDKAYEPVLVWERGADLIKCAVFMAMLFALAVNNMMVGLGRPADASWRIRISMLLGSVLWIALTSNVIREGLEEARKARSMSGGTIFWLLISVPVAAVSIAGLFWEPLGSAAGWSNVGILMLLAETNFSEYLNPTEEESDE